MTTRSEGRVLVLLYAVSLRQPEVRAVLDALQRESRHRIYLWNAASSLPRSATGFDAILVHGSIQLSRLNPRTEELRSWLSTQTSRKIAWIGNDFQGDLSVDEWLSLAGIDAIFTSLDSSDRDRVYASAIDSGVTVESVPAAFCAGDLETLEPLALSQRSGDFVARGIAPQDAEQKQNAARLHLFEDLRQLEGEELDVDVRWVGEPEMFGSGRFEPLLGNRAALVEPQAFFGSEATGKTVWRMPARLFDVVACRTALVLPDGPWWGVLEPNTDYVPIDAVTPNIVELGHRLGDVEELQRVADRAWERLVGSGAFHPRLLAARLDASLPEELPPTDVPLSLPYLRVEDLIGDQLLAERASLSDLRRRSEQGRDPARRARAQAGSSEPERDGDHPGSEESRRQELHGKLDAERQLRLKLRAQLEEERERRSAVVDQLRVERTRRQDVLDTLENERELRRSSHDTVSKVQELRAADASAAKTERTRRQDLLSRLEEERSLRDELTRRLENLKGLLEDQRERRIEFSEQMRDRLEKERAMRLEMRDKMLMERERRRTNEEKLQSLREEIGRRDERISELVDELRAAWRETDG